MRFSSPTLSGRIAYFAEGGRVWGQERFSMSIHRYGRTVRALCELDDVGLLRDTSWSLDASWKPQEGFFRTLAYGVTTAHAWYRINGSAVDYEGYTAQLGRVSQRLVAERAVDFLGFHPLVGDGLITAVCQAMAVGDQKTITCVTNSLSGYGEEGLLAYLVAPQVTYLGRERVRVSAGQFDAEHFTIRWSDTVPSPARFWVLPEHFLLLRSDGALAGTSYELVELDAG